MIGGANVWKKWKKLFLGIGAVIVSIISIIFRSHFNRSGIRDSDESIDNIGDGIKSADETNNRARKVTGDIKSNNTTAKTGIRTAKDILERAKKRSDNSGS